MSQSYRDVIQSYLFDTGVPRDGQVNVAFSLVYTGEHFVIDILVGWLYAAATVYFGSKLLNRWEKHHQRKQAARIEVSASPERTADALSLGR